MLLDYWILFISLLFGLAMLGTWWYAVAVIQPRVQASRYKIFQTYVESRGGQEIPIPKQDNITIFDLFSEKTRKLEAEAEQAHPTLGQQSIYSDHQASVRIGNREVRVAFGEAGESDETTTRIIFWQVMLSGAVNGWARLRSAKSRFKGAFPEVNVESVEVNRDVQIHAYPKKLAYTLFAPNLLDWYQRSTRQPWIYVGEQKLVIVFETYPQPGIFEELEKQVAHIIDAIERSGALEKNQKKA